MNKRISTLMLLMLVALSAAWAGNNTLSITRNLEGASGKIASVPIELSNEDEIVAAQFNVKLPYSKADMSVVLNTARNTNGHSVNCRSLGNNTYTIVIVNMQNKPIGGNSGILVNIPMMIPTDAQPGDAREISITDVVLTNRQGDNIQTGSSTGLITIQKSPSPDLRPIEIKAVEKSVKPLGSITVNWFVENIGDSIAVAGWAENVFLVDAATESRKFVGTVRSDATLLKKARLSRSATFYVPSSMGMDGEVYAEVTVVGNANLGEIIADQGNNTARSAETIQLGKRLYISSDAKTISEDSRSPVRMKLERSGDWSTEETFTLSSQGTGLINVPASVTIPKGQSGVYSYVYAVDNDEVNTEELERVTVAEANGYESVSQEITVLDDEFLTMTLRYSQAEVTEGETFTLTINMAKAADEEQKVLLSTDMPKRFKFPSEVTVPAGETTVDVQIEAVDDDMADVTQTPLFYAVADHYNKAEAALILHDNDLPDITLEFTPDVVNEGAGLTAIIAKLKRTSATNATVNIRLTDDAKGGLYYSTRSITLSKGVEEAQFTIGVVDNAIVDGNRTYTVEAAVYLSSCSCNPSGTLKGIARKTITVLDDDGPSLSLTCSTAGIKEGSEEGTWITVKRNTGKSGRLPLTLTCDDPRMVFEGDAVIPDGIDYVRIKAKANANSVTNDSKTVVITASANGFTAAKGWLQIIDETLPDAVITDFQVDKQEVIVGEKISTVVTVENQGVIDLPKDTWVQLFFDGVPVDTMFTSKALAPGESLQVDCSFNVPDKVKTGRLQAHVNKNNKVSECLYINNTSEAVAVKVNPPFTATAVPAKATINISESITITGQLKGNDIAGKTVEVYIINESRREVLNPVTDENGAYTTTYTPTSVQLGHFSVGACYPGQGLDSEMASFDILGLRRKSTGGVSHKLTLGYPQENSLVLYNPSAIALTNVRAEIQDCPDDVKVTFNRIPLIEGGDLGSLSYTIEGLAPQTDLEWHILKVKVSSDEGATFNMNIAYHNFTPIGMLKADQTNIKTTMIKGESRDFTFTVRNIGSGSTGKMSLVLPQGQSWLTAVTPLNMAPLANGESATIILRMTPTDDMQLNVPVTGNIALNAENADGLAIPFRVETVSGKNGTLEVEVCDEFTYYDETAPRVANAEVVVRHPTTNALVTSGRTGADGKFTAELPEGYYNVNVTADNHDSYRGTVLVDPGTTVSHVVNLSYQAIKVSWEVVETEVEDVYEIKTVVKYETNVPKPVVEVILPDSISQTEVLQNGSTMIYAIVTNKGLIQARNVNVRLGDIKGCVIENLVENGFNLAPGVSVVVPIRISAKSEAAHVPGKFNVRRKSEGFGGFQDCAVNALIDWVFACGGTDKGDYINMVLKLKECAQQNLGGGGGLTFNPEVAEVYGNILSGQIEAKASGSSRGGVFKSVTDCNPCDRDFMACSTKGMRCLYNSMPKATPDIKDLGKGKIMRIKNAVDNYNEVKGFADEVQNMVNADCDHCDFSSCVSNPGFSDFPSSMAGVKGLADISRKNQNAAGSTLPDGVEDLSKYAQWEYSTTKKLPDYMNSLAWAWSLGNTMKAALTHLYDCSYWGKSWLEADSVAMSRFIDKLTKWGEGTGSISAEDRPDGVTEEDYEKLISVLSSEETTNTEQQMTYYQDVIKWCNQNAVEKGHLGTSDYFKTSVEDFDKNTENGKKSTGVCASISLQISQTMTMTRQAFLGTLTVTNGHESEPMKDVKLELKVTNEDGDLATSHEFQINPTSLDGFTGELDLTSGWSLAAKGTGVAKITFIPTKYAAPTEPVKYSFGGTLSYTNPYTGATLTRELFPVTLTVKPSPELDLTYFMQRDVMGDNALTPDVVEPSVPAEFALLINNKGAGDATKVNITTNQPEIIENEKGLLIDFEILSSMVNGRDKTLALGGSVASSFGTIPAKSQAFAQWELKCDLLGHFTDYNVSATHVTSYDNPDLSLLDQVTIHELIHSLHVPHAEAGKDSLVAWLVNDIDDAYDLPDALYFSDATMAEVNTVDADLCQVTRVDAYHYVLKVTPEKNGWTYGNIQDPIGGRSALVSITRRSDNQKISTRNFWQSEWTLRDGDEPLQEYRLHFADNIEHGSEEYVLEYVPVPEKTLEVVSITGPDHTKVIEDKPLAKVSVQFNKPIQPETFTHEDLFMRCQGKNVDMSTVSITSDDNTNFILDMGTTTQEDGYYVLDVHTNGILDNENFAGKNGKKADWIQYDGGLVNLAAKAYPANAGKLWITYEDNSGQESGVKSERRQVRTQAEGEEVARVPYNQNVTLTAEPKEGYAFKGWYVDDECVSTDLSYTTAYLGHTSVQARFYENNIRLTLSYNDLGGTVTGGGSGLYAYGTKLSLRALATDGYVFTGWLKDNTIVTNDEYLHLTLEEAQDVQAEFVMLGSKVGDVNLDGFITVSDMSALGSVVLKEELEHVSYVYSDVNLDRTIDISDMPALSNMLFVGGSEARAMKRTSRMFPTAECGGMVLADTQLPLESEADAALSFEGVFQATCFQFDLLLPEGITVEEVAGNGASQTHVFGWNRMDNGLVRVIGYAADNAQLPCGPLANVTISAQPGVTDGIYDVLMCNIVMGRSDASSAHLPNRMVKITVGNGATGINGTDGAARHSGIYDLQGRKVNSTTDINKGVYIMNSKKYIYR